MASIEEFINTLRNLTKSTPEEIAEFAASPERRGKIEGASGGNIKVNKNMVPSENYTNALVDAIRFYRNEFGVTPHANIAYDPDWLIEKFGYNIGGVTIPREDSNGNLDVVLRDITKKDEAEDIQNQEPGAWSHFHPNNSVDIANAPTHELGHVLYYTLFPEVDTSSNSFARTIGLRDKLTDGDAKLKILKDALDSIGATSENDREAAEKAISEYAMRNADETIAEALTDYYYNRDDAADLSKAIVGKLKNASSAYYLKRTGGVDLAPHSEGTAPKFYSTQAKNFYKNLRRFSPIQ